MKWVTALALALALLSPACSKKKHDAPPPPPTNNEPAIPAAELARGEDACKAYITAACKCAEKVPAVQTKCDEAKAFPEVVRMATELTMSTDSTPLDVKQAAQSIRKTIAECIQQTAQLPTLGC